MSVLWVLGLVGVGALIPASTEAAGAKQPLYPRFFSHFEYLEDRDASADAILRQSRLLVGRDIPAQQNLHRGEVQAAWFAEHRPEVLDVLRRPGVELAYHPHPMRPYTDLVAKMAELPWDEAVLAYAELERCAVDFSTGTLDCSRPGGLAALEQVLGREVTGVCNGGPDAIPGFVYAHQQHIPVRLAGGIDKIEPDGGREPIFGRNTYAFWYMGQLVIRHFPWARNPMMDVTAATTRGLLDALDPTVPHLFGVLGTDKVNAPGANAAADRLYQPGMTLEQLRPAPNLLTPPGKVEAYWRSFGGMLDELEKEVKHRPGSRFVGDADLPGLFVPPADTLSRAELRTLATTLLSLPAPTSNVATALPLELTLPDRTVSLGDAWQGLHAALRTHRDTRVLPEQVVVGGLLGPIGDPVPLPTPDPARRTPVPTADLLAALPAPSDRVAYSLSLSPGQDPALANEQLLLFARLFLDLDAGVAPLTLDRPTTVPGMVPQGVVVAGGPRALRQRWHWYTATQYWTAKRARWR